MPQPDILITNEDTLLLSVCREVTTEEQTQDERNLSLGWVKILLKHGANINHKNIMGETPLSIAENAQNQELWLHLRDIKTSIYLF